MHRRPFTAPSSALSSGSLSASSSAQVESPLCVGSWNVSWWTQERLAPLSSLQVHLCALQETKLACLPLENVRSFLRRQQYTLHHGAAVSSRRSGGHGDSAGVGVLAAPGVAVSPLSPIGAAWHRLHGMARLHGVVLHRRPGLPLGLRVFSVYAPLQRDSARPAFNAAFIEFVAQLDMQIPTLLLGDFNGSVAPERDFTAGHGSVCPLLTRLLDLGGPFIDLQMAVSPAEWAFTFTMSHLSSLRRSRCDLALGNRAALGLVQRVWVASHIMDGGHSPLLVELRPSSSWAISWQPPKPRLPPLLQISSVALRALEDWKALLGRWEVSDAVRSLKSPTPTATTAQALSALLQRALEALVDLAGGWDHRPPIRRLAYESQQVRRARASLQLLSYTLALVSREDSDGLASLGCFSASLVRTLAQLRRRGFHPVASSRFLLREWTEAAIIDVRRDLSTALREMRTIRSERWKAQIPRLWDSQPKLFYRLLQGESSAWGATPILDESGQQCCSHASVDRAVRDYWVKTVWRMHESVDPVSSWSTFQASRFYEHVPRCSWPHAGWTLERVRSVLGSMREGSSPGVRAIPISVWKSLPEFFLQRIAVLLTLVEAEGAWPDELLQAYVTMIPKASGGSRPQDQRPITVLDVVYRLWATGITQCWAPVLHGCYLGPTVMGFRAQASTLHLAQLLTDAIELQRRRGQPLWLVKFDVAKCFPSLPWWAIFGVMETTGISPVVVRCLRHFYAHLLHRFRYGTVEGSAWTMANGLAQGCPASPDLLNILFEPFHRWAGSQRVGVEVAGAFLASSSFADDICLLATSLSEAELLVGGYQAWCDLLRIHLHLEKTELWCSELAGGQPVTLKLASGPLVLTTRSTFRMVGVELGNDEKRATAVHLEARLPKTLLGGRRLAALSVPVAVACQLWRSAILPQALYGCEIRNITYTQILPLWALGKTTVPRLLPLLLNQFAAVEVLGGPPFGAHALRDPRLEMLSRRLHWLQGLANHTGIVGTLHRLLACGTGSIWTEPSAALAGALDTLHWQVRRNPEALSAEQWPILAPEPSYKGAIIYTPVDGVPPRGAVWTDGSVRSSGGAAALQRDSDLFFQATVPVPRSSTHCELVALNLVSSFQPPPPVVLTDSLCSLQLIGSWGRRSLRSIYTCFERSLVRQFIAYWDSCTTSPPVLEKVQAHDDSAAASGVMKALGNAAVDALAKQAASGSGAPAPSDRRYDDAVEICDAAGAAQVVLASAIASAWWAARQREGGARRAWLGQLYPLGLEIDWPPSQLLFRRPAVTENTFVYPAPYTVLKWVARARSGALMTQSRLVTTRLATSARCLCCREADEDDQHAVLGCSVTGASDLVSLIPRLWADAYGKASPSVVQLPGPWIQQHLPQLAVGLLPSSLRRLLSEVESWLQSLILKRFHLSLCSRLAEVLRRREQLRDVQLPPAVGASSASSSGPPPSSARVLTVAELRAAEASSSVAPAPTGRAATPRAALREEKQRVALSLDSWVKVHPFLQAGPVAQGEASVALLLLWEADHHQLYPCDKVDLRLRLISFTKRLVDAVAADPELSRWMEHKTSTSVLSPGLRPSRYTRWAVRIKPEVGEPFLGAWKTYLASVVHQQQQRLAHVRGSSPDSGPPPKRPRTAAAPSRKRPYPGPSPPRHTKEARLARLRAAKATLAVRHVTFGTTDSAASPSADRDPVSPSAGPRALPPGLT